MSDPRKQGADDSLRALLRAADSLAGEVPPTAAQIEAWRAAMRDARRRPFWRPGWVRVLVPALGVAGAIVLAAILIPRGGPRPAPNALAAIEPPPIANAPEGAPAPAPLPLPAPAPAPDSIPTGVEPRLVARAAPPTALPARPAPGARQSLQFTAANGTRILWILDPNLEL